MTKPGRKAIFLLLFILSMGLLGYTAYRSHSLSMTHDESASYIYFHDIDVWKSLTDDSAWKSANNHLLNTWLFQKTTAIFGHSDWALRLPNVLAHLLYLLAGIYIILQLTNRLSLGIAAWVLFNLNPYLLDFFSLARGYGLAMGFTMLSLAFFVAFIKRPKASLSLAIFFAVGLSILSNFTQFVYLLALGLAYLFFCLQHEHWGFKKTLKWLWPPALVCACLALMLFKPIVLLQSSGEFEWGVDSLYQTFETLSVDSLYGKNHLGKHTVTIFFYLASLLTVLALLSGYYLLFKPESNLESKLLGKTALVFSGIVLIVLMQNALLGTKHFINRKSLIFIPIWGLLVFSWIAYCFRERSKFLLALALPIILFGFFHFYKTINFNSSREWWYDRNTLTVLEDLEQKLDGEKISFGVHWWFHPTSSYYKETKNFTFFDDLRYDKGIFPDEGYDYYYVLKNDYEQFLKDGYEIEKVYDGFGYLLRQKPSH